PLIVVPSINWLCVHTVATVVISLIVTLAGGCAPTDAISAIAGLSPFDGFAAGLPPFATRYRIDPLGTDGALIENRPSAPVRAWPNCGGLPALAAKSVTVELAIGARAAKTWPVIVAALATPALTQTADITNAKASLLIIAPSNRVDLPFRLEVGTVNATQFREERRARTYQAPGQRNALATLLPPSGRQRN